MSTSEDGKRFEPMRPPMPKSFWQNITGHPFVSLGGLSLLGILAGGMYTIKTGNSALGTKLMGARVGVQMGIVALLVGGTGYITFKKQQLPEKGSEHL